MFSNTKNDHTVVTAEEPIRREYLQYISEFDELNSSLAPIIREYYAECGRPKTTKINNFALPKEILDALNEIPQ